MNFDLEPSNGGRKMLATVKRASAQSMKKSMVQSSIGSARKTTKASDGIDNRPVTRSISAAQKMIVVPAAAADKRRLPVASKSASKPPTTKRKASSSSSSSSLSDDEGSPDGVRLVIQGNEKVTNILGSSETRLRNAKRHWIRYSSSDWGRCSNLSCSSRAEHGGHVKIHRHSLWHWYIVPVCHRCNPAASSSTFTVRPGTIAVRDTKASTWCHLKSWRHHVRPAWNAVCRLVSCFTNHS